MLVAGVVDTPVTTSGLMMTLPEDDVVVVIAAAVVVVVVVVMLEKKDPRLSLMLGTVVGMMVVSGKEKLGGVGIVSIVSGETKSISVLQNWVSCCFVVFFSFLNVLISNKAISWNGPKTGVCQFYVLPHRETERGMTSVSVGNIILTSNKPVWSRRPELGSNPDQTSCALPRHE